MAEARPAGGRKSPCGADECVAGCRYLDDSGGLCDKAAKWRGPLTVKEANAKIAAHRSKPRTPPKPRGNPEAQVGFAIDQRMAEAGFHVHDFSRKVFTAGVWVSAVTTGTPDRYYWHPDGRNIWVELKAPGGELRPEQAAFIAGHAHSPIEAVCWDSVEEAMAWLAAFD